MNLCLLNFINDLIKNVENLSCNFNTTDCEVQSNFKPVSFNMTVVLYYLLGRNYENRQVLGQVGQDILKKAESSLKEGMKLLEDGYISMNHLILIQEHSERFMALCEHISDEGRNESLQQLLNRRIMELSAFQEERKKVSSFVTMCSLIRRGKDTTFQSWSLLSNFL